MVVLSSGQSPGHNGHVFSNKLKCLKNSLGGKDEQLWMHDELLLGEISFSPLSWSRKTLEKSDVLISSPGSAQMATCCTPHGTSSLAADDSSWASACCLPRWLFQPPSPKGEREGCVPRSEPSAWHTECEMKRRMSLSPEQCKSESWMSKKGSRLLNVQKCGG